MMNDSVTVSRVPASKVLVVVLFLVCVLVSPKTFGTELKAATARAFQQYVDLTEARIRGEVARSEDGFLKSIAPRDSKGRGTFVALLSDFPIMRRDFG